MNYSLLFFFYRTTLSKLTTSSTSNCVWHETSNINLDAEPEEAKAVQPVNRLFSIHYIKEPHKSEMPPILTLLLGNERVNNFAMIFKKLPNGEFRNILCMGKLKWKQFHWNKPTYHNWCNTIYIYIYIVHLV